MYPFKNKIIRAAWYFALALLVGFVLVSCGGGGGGQSSSSTPTNSTTAIINKSGGAIALADGTTVTFAAGIVKDGTTVTISTLPPEASTSTEISSLSSLVRVEFPIDALIASGSSPDAGITVSIPSSGVVAGVTTSGVTSTVGQAYKFIQAKLTAGADSVIFYGKVGAAATSIAAKIAQVQMVNFYKSVGTAAQNFLTVDILVNLVQPNVPTAGTLFKIQYIGSGVNFSTYSDTDYSFVDSLPNSGLTLGKIPLVLVHGIQINGCEGNADAYKSTWEKFIMFFFSSQGQALRSKYQLYTFSYKTFDHIEDNGLLLAHDLKVIFGNVPTVIVAHSMGGLVTRSAMVQHAGIGAQIGGVITLGTPHHGTKVVDDVAGYVDKNLCVLTTSSPGSDDLKWDNFDDPSKACGNSFLCGSTGINTSDTSSNYTKYIPYAGVWDPSSLVCAAYLGYALPALIFDSTTYLMCAGAGILNIAGYSSDGMVPKVSARFTDYIGGQYYDKLPWSAKPRTYQGINHATIINDPKVYEQYPDGSAGGIKQDLLNFYAEISALTAPTDTTPPSFPTGLTATALSSSQINLTWAASTDDVGVAGYKIYRGGSLITSQTTLSYSDTGLSPSTQYCYTISAFDTAGNASVQSSQQCATTQAGGTVPTTPTGISATAGNGQATISWNAVTGATSYNLYMASVSGVTKSNYSSLTDGMQHVGVTSPSIQASLTNGTTYYFVVTAVDTNGESSESSQVSATPQVSPVTTSTLNDTGITASQCYQSGSNTLVSCISAAALALNNAQDGMAGRDANAATNSNTDGKLGFSFTSVPAAGSDPGGCVQDNVTGLMWEVKTADGGLRDWTKTYTNYSTTYNPSNLYGTSTDASGFVTAVNAINLCGYSDWRLPTADELQSIVDYGVASPGPTIDASWFPNTQGYAFWSASPYVGYSDYAWVVSFNGGYVYYSYRGYGSLSLSNVVRLVRAGQSPIPPRYTVSADGQAVTDNQTKLIWRRCAEGMVYSSGTCTGTAGTFTHEAALMQAATQASSTGIAWRLPDVKELSSIADKTLRNPAIDSTAFPATPARWFWSASPSVGGSGSAWYFYFFNGDVNVNYRFSSGYVRLVRAGQ